MNETIGEKGGHNDLLRTNRIKEEKKKKEQQEEELEKLEKKIKKKQLYTLIKSLPIVIGGNVIHTLTNNSSKEEQKDNKPEQRIITTKEKETVIVYIPKPLEKAAKKEAKPLEKEENKKSINLEEEIEFLTPEKEKSIQQPESKEELSIYTTIETPTANVERETFQELKEENQEKIKQVKTRKIIDEYEKQLKDIRYELRNTIYDYEILVDEDEKIIESEDAEKLLDRLSTIIDKLEDLKRRIKIDKLDQIDDNYIYFLIENYFQEFRDGKVIKEIKDSPLYILIEDKLRELDKKKEVLAQEVEHKKEKLKDKEQSFEEFKKHFNSIDRINKDLLSFQYDQEQLLKEIQDKVRNATTIKERVETEVQGLNRQSRRLLRLLTLQLFIPGVRSAKGIASSTAAYLYFMNHVVNPRTVTKKYKVIMVKDYSDEIINSIESIDSTLKLLGRTSSQIDKMIKEVKEKYRDYIGVVPECDEIIRNMNKVKKELEEKEYEMKKIKKQQELELEKNNAKVKTRGEYPVN